MSVYSRWMRPLISKEEAGFTLLEVMIAIVILTVGLLALATLQLSAVRGNTFSHTLTDAKDWGSDRFETMLTDPDGYYDNLDLQDTDPNPAVCTNYIHPNPPQGYTIEYVVCGNQICPNTKTIVMTITGIRFGTQRRVQLIYVM